MRGAANASTVRTSPPGSGTSLAQARISTCYAFSAWLTFFACRFRVDSEHITLSLRNSEKATSEASEKMHPELEWWTQGCKAGYLHTGMSQKGQVRYAPVLFLRQKYHLIRGLLRDSDARSGAQRLVSGPSVFARVLSECVLGWCKTCPPWQPLGDNGIEAPMGDDVLVRVAVVYKTCAHC